MNDPITKTSKFLSLILRHQPERIGLTLDANGWADTQTLLTLVEKTGRPLSRSLLEKVVAENDKQRFAFNEDKTKIRASQGHSIEIDLALRPQTPPEILFHGTAAQFVGPIRLEGLVSQKRQHVHLSLEEETATKVGQRHGVPVILRVSSGEMHRKGIVFYCSENGVWLTEKVPTEFLETPDSA